MFNWLIYHSQNSLSYCVEGRWIQKFPSVFQCLPHFLHTPEQLLPFLRLLQVPLDEVTFAIEQSNLQQTFKGFVVSKGGIEYKL